MAGGSCLLHTTGLVYGRLSIRLQVLATCLMTVIATRSVCHTRLCLCVCVRFPHTHTQSHLFKHKRGASSLSVAFANCFCTQINTHIHTLSHTQTHIHTHTPVLYLLYAIAFLDNCFPFKMPHPFRRNFQGGNYNTFHSLTQNLLCKSFKQ